MAVISVDRVLDVTRRRIEGAKRVVALELQDYIRSQSSRMNPNRTNPSKRGEYPKTVTGDFQAGIRVDPTPTGFRIHSKVPHALWLQEGTKWPDGGWKMRPRPFVTLAMQEVDWAARVAKIAETGTITRLPAIKTHGTAKQRIRI